MKEELSLAFIEHNIVWEDALANEKKLNQLIAPLNVDLIVLPEMFNTGFSMNVEHAAQPPFGETFAWMKKKSIENNCAICGSIATKENNQFYNRFYFVTPTNSFIYDKKHLFSYGSEADFYTAGRERVTFEYLGWKIRPIVCYDLRFPVWCRNDDHYDLMICVANWPAVRIDAWNTLLKARAIENMAYVIGVNRTGEDGNSLTYNGNSKVFDVLGKELIVNKADKNCFTTKLNYSYINKQREKFGFLKDGDGFIFKG